MEFFFFFFSAGKEEKNNLVEITGSEVGLNFDWLQEKKRLFFVFVYTWNSVFMCAYAQLRGKRGVAVSSSQNFASQW